MEEGGRGNEVEDFLAKKKFLHFFFSLFLFFSRQCERAAAAEF